MKKILFFIHSYYPFEDANTNVLLPIIDYLKRENSCYILCCNISNKAQKAEKKDKETIYRYRNSYFFRNYYYTYYSQLVNKMSIKSFLKTILWLLAHFLFFLDPCAKKFKKILKNEKIDVVLSVSSPFYIQSACYKYFKKKKGSCIWIAYTMDSFSRYYSNCSNKKLENIEFRILNKSQYLLTNNFIYNEYQNTSLKQLNNKTIVLPYTNLIPVNKGKIYKNSTFSTFLYIGSLNDKNVRDPSYFLNLFAMLNQNHYKLVFIVNNLNGEMDILINYYIKKGLNLTLLRNLPLDYCKKLMKEDVILINLGNKISNQMPSKLNDYISSGNPIINVYSIHNDTSKTYLNKYPSTLNLFEADSLEISLYKLTLFLKTCKKVSYNEIVSNYKSCLSQNVLKKCFKKINL